VVIEVAWEEATEVTTITRTEVDKETTITEVDNNK